MTIEEFAEQYARGSGVTVEWLRERGRVPLPCSCDFPLCQGWQMAYVPVLSPPTPEGDDDAR